MTIQLELDLQFKTSYIYDLLDSLHDLAKQGSKLPYRDKKDVIHARFTALRNQINDLSFYALSSDIIDHSSFVLIQDSVCSSIHLFWNWSA